MVTKRRKRLDAEQALPKKGKRIQTRKALQASIDRAESAKVRKRSEGQCEVYVVVTMEPDGWHCAGRCQRRAEHVMHLIGGRGKRGIGISALSDHKLHGCGQHHREIDGDIGGKKLKRIGGSIPLWTDVYERTQ